MSTTLNKLEYLDETKNQIKTALNQFGSGITDETTFREYADKIDDIYNNWPKVTGEGTDITLDNTKNGKLSLELNGNTEQDGDPTPNNEIPIKVVKGSNNVKIENKNLIDWANPTASNANYTFENDILTVTNSLTSTRLIRYEITEIFKKNTGKSLYCQNEGVEKSGGGNNVVMRFVYKDETPQSDINITSSQKLDIPSDVSNIESVNIRVSSTGLGSVTITKPMLAFGETATDYVRHTEQNYTITLPNGMEMCKIGDYQDYIYKNGDNWYKHKEIKKVVLDGSVREDWGYSNDVFFYKVISDYATKNNIPYCSIYKGISNVSSASATAIQQNNRIAFRNTHASELYRMYVKDTRFTSADDFVANLSTNNLTIHYATDNPVEEPITDTTFINQLNDFYNNAKSYSNQTNITQTNDDLPFIISANALLKGGNENE